MSTVIFLISATATVYSLLPYWIQYLTAIKAGLKRDDIRGPCKTFINKNISERKDKPFICTVARGEPMKAMIQIQEQHSFVTFQYAWINRCMHAKEGSCITVNKLAIQLTKKNPLSSLLLLCSLSPSATKTHIHTLFCPLPIPFHPSLFSFSEVASGTQQVTDMVTELTISAT